MFGDFFFQFLQNKYPITNAGPARIIDQEIIYHSKLPLLIAETTSKDIYKSPASVKVMVPIHSRFQDNHNKIAKTKTGILCINNPSKQLQILLQLSKTSNENSVKNKRSTIDKTLGVQYRVLDIFFIINQRRGCL
jgi:hypothetical protein